MGKPPCCEMTFEAAPDISTPPDLTATVSLGFDGSFNRPTNTVTISRAAETSHDKGVAVKKYQDLCKYNYFNLLYQLKLYASTTPSGAATNPIIIDETCQLH